MSRDELTDAEKFLYDDPRIYSIPEVYEEGCYICEDPDYAMMGLPLCFACPECGSHVAADEGYCECGWEY